MEKMESKSKLMNLMKLKTQLEDVCHMERNDQTRRENLFHSLAKANERTAKLQLQIDQLKQIKDRYKEQVIKTWPAIRKSYRKQQSIFEDTKKTIKNTHDLKLTESGAFTPGHEFRLAGGLEVQEVQEPEESIQLRFPKSSKPREREVKLSTHHQQVVSYPQNHEVVKVYKEKDSPVQKVKTNSKQLKFKLENDDSRLDEENDAYDKLLQTSSSNEARMNEDESSEDETDVETQMAAFVTRLASKKSSDKNGPRSSKIRKSESSSDDSSESKENKPTTATIMQTTQKFAALHLGLDSDSDVSPKIDQTNKNNEKDEDFTFFD